MSSSFGRSRFIGNGAPISVAMLAAPGCSTISRKESSERAAVDKLPAQVVADAHDIRMLQSEVRTRARLPELQRWNDTVLALSPPKVGQFLRDGVQLASYAPGAPRVAAPAPVAPALVNVAPASAAPAPVSGLPLLAVLPPAAWQHRHRRCRPDSTGHSSQNAGWPAGQSPWWECSSSSSPASVKSGGPPNRGPIGA